MVLKFSMKTIVKVKLLLATIMTLTALNACTDEDNAAGKGSRVMTFSVNTPGQNGWNGIDGSRSGSTQSQQMGEPVEMKGKINGNPVYLSSEVTEGFPGDTPAITRGTQISDANNMSAFGVTAFMGSQKYMDHEKLTKQADAWKPQKNYFWLGEKSIDFYAWYPYNSAEGTNGIPAGMTLKEEDFSSISYIVPQEVSQQEDLMFAVNKNASEPADGKATSLDFKHSLAAVKFVVGNLPAGSKITSVALKGVKYKGDLAVTAGNNGAAQLVWSNLANETRDFTVVTDKEVKENDTDPAITNANQTFFMMPQTLPDDAMVEVVVEKEMGTKVTLTGALQDATAAVGAKNKWEAGNTYTYTINLYSVTAEITFYKGKNYTAHNISANGDPFTVDFNYPQTVSNIKLRFAYVNNDGSFEVINADGNPNTSYNPNYYDLTGKKTSVTLRSPVMNNLGIVACAKKEATAFVVQMQVKASLKMDMPVDPEKPSEKREYLPETDDNKWYTIWKGKMYPPNYIQVRNDAGLSESNRQVIVARCDYKNQQVTFNDAMAGRTLYWEVDANHPVFGKGKNWRVPFPFWEVNRYESYWLWDMQKNNKFPGDNEKLGEKLQAPPKDPWYWTCGAIGDGTMYCMRGYGDFHQQNYTWDGTWLSSR